MERSGYLDLYVTEAQEYVQTLHEGLVNLGREAGRSALEEAFRAAHTLKGMSGLMGYRAAEARARELEDRLEGVKDGRVAVDDDLIEELLSDAASLERLITESVEVETSGQSAVAEESTADRSADTRAPTPGPRSRRERSPPGTRLTVWITLRDDVLIRSATALLIVQRLGAVTDVIASQPAEFDDDFPETFAVHIGSADDRAAVDAVLRQRGDVLRVAFEVVSAAPSAHVPRFEATMAPPASATAPAAHVEGRPLRPVEPAHLDALAAGVGELTTLRARLAALASSEAWEEFADTLERVSRLTRDMQAAVLSVRLVPIAEVFDAFPGVVQDYASGLGKDVAFGIEGGDIELDRALLDALAEPLLHLLENALEHGLEAPDARRAAGKPGTGELRLRASRGQASLRIEVSDDGQGVAKDRVVELARMTGLTATPGPKAEPLTDDRLLRLLSRPGFSTAPLLAGRSHYGMGLDRVASRVHRLGGKLAMHTVRGEGTRFTIELPLTSPLMRALRLDVGDEEYAIPLTNVAEVLSLDEGMITRVQGEESLRVQHRLVPLVRLAKTLALPTETDTETAAVLVHSGAQRYALAVHGSAGEEQIVVRGFASPVDLLPIFSGAALLSDGRPVLVLDPAKVL